MTILHHYATKTVTNVDLPKSLGDHRISKGSSQFQRWELVPVDDKIRSAAEVEQDGKLDEDEDADVVPVAIEGTSQQKAKVYQPQDEQNHLKTNSKREYQFHLTFLNWKIWDRNHTRGMATPTPKGNFRRRKMGWILTKIPIMINP